MGEEDGRFNVSLAHLSWFAFRSAAASSFFFAMASSHVALIRRAWKRIRWTKGDGMNGMNGRGWDGMDERWW